MRCPRWGKGIDRFRRIQYIAEGRRGAVTAIPAIPFRHHCMAFGVDTCTSRQLMPKFWNSSLVLSLARPLCRTRNDLPCLLALSCNPSCAALIGRASHVFHNMDIGSEIWQYLVKLTKIHQVPHLRLQDTPGRCYST